MCFLCFLKSLLIIVWKIEGLNLILLVFIACIVKENFYNTYNLKLFFIKYGTYIKLKTLDGASCVILKRHCMYQIVHIPKHLNILKHFIQPKINSLKYVSMCPIRWRIYISLRTTPKINSLLLNRVLWSLRRS